MSISEKFKEDYIIHDSQVEFQHERSGTQKKERPSYLIVKQQQQQQLERLSATLAKITSKALQVHYSWILISVPIINIRSTRKVCHYLPFSSKLRFQLNLKRYLLETSRFFKKKQQLYVSLIWNSLLFTTWISE